MGDTGNNIVRLIGDEQIWQAADNNVCLRVRHAFQGISNLRTSLARQALATLIQDLELAAFNSEFVQCNGMDILIEKIHTSHAQEQILPLLLTTLKLVASTTQGIAWLHSSIGSLSKAYGLLQYDNNTIKLTMTQIFLILVDSAKNSSTLHTAIKLWQRTHSYSVQRTSRYHCYQLLVAMLHWNSIDVMMTSDQDENLDENVEKTTTSLALINSILLHTPTKEKQSKILFYLQESGIEPLLKVLGKIKVRKLMHQLSKFQELSGNVIAGSWVACQKLTEQLRTLTNDQATRFSNLEQCYGRAVSRIHFLEKQLNVPPTYGIAPMFKALEPNFDKEDTVNKAETPNRLLATSFPKQSPPPSPLPPPPPPPPPPSFNNNNVKRSIGFVSRKPLQDSSPLISSLPTSPTRARTSKVYPITWTETETSYFDRLASRSNKTVWDSISRHYQFDAEAFDGLFDVKGATAQKVKKFWNFPPGLSPVRYHELSKILEKLPPVAVIINAILSMDETWLSEKNIRDILESLPLPAEIKAIRDELQGGHVTLPQLDPSVECDPFTFIVKLDEIPCIHFRLRVWTLRLQYHEKMRKMKTSIRVMHQAIRDLERSDGLRTLLGVLLAIGNHIKESNSESNKNHAGFDAVELFMTLPYRQSNLTDTSLLFFVACEASVHSNDIWNIGSELQNVVGAVNEDIFDTLQQAKQTYAIVGALLKEWKQMNLVIDNPFDALEPVAVSFLQDAIIESKSVLDEALNVAYHYREMLVFFGVNNHDLSLYLPCVHWGLRLSQCGHGGCCCEAVSPRIAFQKVMSIFDVLKNETELVLTKAKLAAAQSVPNPVQSNGGPDARQPQQERTARFRFSEKITSLVDPMSVVA